MPVLEEVQIRDFFIGSLINSAVDVFYWQPVSFLWNNQHALLVECYLYNGIIFQIIRVMGGVGGGEEE